MQILLHYNQNGDVMNKYFLKQEIEAVTGFNHEMSIDFSLDCSENATALLLGTAAQESSFIYARQFGFNMTSNIGAFGLFGMEFNTCIDLLRNSAKAVDILTSLVIDINGKDDITNFINSTKFMMIKNNLVYNLPFSIMACRLQYARFEEPIPDKNDIKGLAKYWKKYWNTDNGAGTVEKFIDNYNKLVL